MDAPVLENSVQSFIENSAKDKVLVISNITTDLVNGQLQLVTFIEKLQKYLTNTDVTIRTRCVRLIGEVLHQIPNTQLSRNEVELLVTYLCERLTDHHSIQPPALYALLALSGCKNFPNGLASKICRVVFQNVQNQSLSQPDRCSVYTILSNFLDTKMEELQKMEGDFVLGFIQVMDTEKDPRNLMICFQCARTIILNFSLGVFVEEMFEVTSCYFPIDFTPPPSDNTKMTREDLIKGLRGCLSATEKFGEYAYPLILEKLTSDIQSAKLDCLQTLIECVEVYGIKQLREFQSSLYNCIKNEVFSSGNPVMEQLALDTLRTIVRTLSKTKLEGPDSPVYAYVAEILQDCKRYLTDEDTRLLVPVCRLLISCAQGADRPCCQILKDVLPHLINLYNKSSVNSQRKTVLEMMSKFVRVVSGYREGQCHQMLLSYIDELSTLIEGALIDSSSHLRLTGVAGVNEMIKVSTPHTQKYTELVLDKVFSDEDKDVRISCLEPLETVARVNSPVLESTVIPHILRKLKTEPMDEVISEVLSTVTVTYNVVTMVTPELFLPLHSIASALPNEENEEQAKNIVICLLTIITKNCHDSLSLQYFCDTVIKSIYKLVITSSMYPVSVLQQTDVLDRLSMCVRCIATRCNDSQLQDLYLETTQLFLHGDLSVLSISDGTHGDLSVLSISDETFKPFEVSSPWQQTQVISMVTPVICTCNEKIQDEDLYVQKLLCLCETSQHNYTQLEACKCLAGLLNKQPDILQKLDTSGLEQTIQSQPLENRRLSLQLLIWLTKALVMRGHQKSKSLVMFLMTMLSDSDIGLEAATGFNTILTDSPDVLNKSMNVVIRMMYKQRLFVENVSHLVKNFETTSHDTKKNYLRVLSSMLKTLPKQVLLTELPPLFPLMIHSLLSDDLELQMSTMDTLYDLTHDAPEIVSKHVDSMIPQLLKLSVTKSSMKLRQSALQCIGVVTVLPVYIVQPYKAQVIKGLEKCLDDNKRLVRKEAVLARNEWFLLGTTNN